MTSQGNTWYIYIKGNIYTIFHPCCIYLIYIPLCGYEFASHVNLFLIRIGILEDTKIPYAFNSLLCLTITVLHHLSEFILFKYLFLRHMHVGYTNVSFVSDLCFNDFGSTYVEFTIAVLTWYDLISYSLVMNNVLLHLGFSNMAYII